MLLGRRREVASVDSEGLAVLLKDYASVHIFCEFHSNIVPLRERLLRSLGEAAREVVIHNACGLQVRVHNRRADEVEAALLQVFADLIGERRARWDLTESSR